MLNSALKMSLIAVLGVTTAIVPVSASMAQNAKNTTRTGQVLTGASKVGSGPVIYRYQRRVLAKPVRQSRQSTPAKQVKPATRYTIPTKYQRINSPQLRRNVRVLPSAWRSAQPVRRAAPVRQPVRRATPRPTPRPVNMTPRRPVEMGPARGAIGTPIRLRINQNFGASPAILSFKAVVSRGVPARVHARLSGGGSNFSIPAPIQLCIQGGGTWQAELVLSNGRNLGVVGSFTPTNCPR